MGSQELVPHSAFELDEHGDTAFERMSKTNGTRYWYARDLMNALGYDNWAAFRNILNKAIGVCTSVGIIVTENFIQLTREIDGKSVDDFQLSRLACCLTALNGDHKKPKIAFAQVYFAALDAVVSGNPIQPENVDRIAIREEISAREVTLSGAAKDAGVKFYGRFQDAGYRGMYNMDYDSLKRLKGIPDMRRSLLDYMRKEELAGNLFRLTLTEGRIKRDSVQGQSALEEVAELVGRKVRDTMIEQTGVRPEEIPIGPDIKDIKRSIKSARKTFQEIDNLTKQRKHEAEEQQRITAIMSEIVPGCAECANATRSAHFGSPQCSSGSLAAGGAKAHCDCDYCSSIS